MWIKNVVSWKDYTCQSSFCKKYQMSKNGYVFLMSDYCKKWVTIKSQKVHVIALKVQLHVLQYVLGHLQRLIDVGGQDGQEVIYATDKKSTFKTIKETIKRQKCISYTAFLSIFASSSVSCLSVISFAYPVSPRWLLPLIWGVMLYSDQSVERTIAARWAPAEWPHRYRPLTERSVEVH